ncbi:tetratricopeptide repeat protein [Sideroxydans lithotrophicus]|uniref:TPR repeat-containing protein n=1 Tax=Sideroxydans lithotrophicus (strain ES-1) TaxID=580332 RepID=D5CNB9_SIDLE|nr:tetratricopeptide repeat protein [Sideroxydans lithotrophicus]ADE12816.1 TPR repeat-containing protein [Sideroxydans lithotrophicus ES-1]
MSLINQVLNELENRGSNAPLGEIAIRAVPPRKRSYVKLYAFLAMALVVVLAGVRWFMERPAPVPERAVIAVAPSNPVATDPNAVPASAPAPVMAGGEPSVLQSSDGLHGKPLLEVGDEEQVEPAPEVEKPKRHNRKRKAQQLAGNAGDLPTEDPEIQQLKTVSPQQRAANEFGKANLALQEGRTNDALAGYRNVLLIDASYKEARRAWVALLINLKRNDEAESVLKKGLRHDPHDALFAMQLARLQVARDDVPLALKTLQKTLPYAEGQADYQAFVAALFQRLNQHEEAVAHYRVALRLVPNGGIWWMGMGISLQALQRNDEARVAYQRALATSSLTPQLQAFVQNKLKEL